MKPAAAKPALTPKLRFPEFLNKPAWEETILGRVLTEHGETDDGASEVHSVSVHKGVINQVEHLGRSFAAADRSNYNLAKPHDVIYTKSPTGDFPWGVVKQNRLPYNVIVSPLYGVFSPVNRYLGYIFHTYFESPIRTTNYLAPITQKGAKNTIQISNATFLSKGLYLPAIEAEHKKIAECLSSLDEVIAAQSQKLDALKTHKKGLMQQLFPREGETLPRLRFPEFMDAPGWEEEKLDDLFRFQDGFSFKSTDFVKTKEDSTQVVRITDINNKNTNEDKVYVPNAFLASNKLNKYFVENGELLLSLTGAAGFNFFFWDGGRALINQRTAKVTPKRKSSPALAQLLERMVHEKINARGEGQNNNLSKEFLSSVILLLPEPSEQQRIATCLTTLDDLITAQSAKLSALKTHKKGLMQQLFPSAADADA